MEEFSSLLSSISISNKNNSGGGGDRSSDSSNYVNGLYEEMTK